MAEELETVKALRVEAAATVAEAKLASSTAREAASEVCSDRSHRSFGTNVTAGFQVLEEETRRYGR